MTGVRGRGLVVAALAGLALAGLWRLLPAATPPVYDGICVADPYRLLGSSPPPTSASMTYPPGPFRATEVATGETPSQAAVLILGDTFSPSGSAITLSVAPIRPPGPKPTKGSIDGNVYRFSVTDASGATPAAQSPITVELRGTRSSPAHTLERLDGTTWTPLQTFLVGCGDVFAADTNRLGIFALVTTGTPPGSAPGGGPPVGLIAGALAVVLIAAMLLLIRLNRTRAG